MNVCPQFSMHKAPKRKLYKFLWGMNILFEYRVLQYKMAKQIGKCIKVVQIPLVYNADLIVLK